MAKAGLKNDRYRKNRGGHSRLLNISCEKCGEHICYYQKDGPGILKRMYFDRMDGLKINSKSNLTCPNCQEILGTPFVYKKENRPAFRLYVGALTKKITKA